MSIRPRSIKALTLARRGHNDYQLTLWSDGLARFDGPTGNRHGAWECHVDQNLFAWLVGLATNIDLGKRETLDSSATQVVDTEDNRFLCESSKGHEPGTFWRLGTAIDGLTHRVSWAPLDAKRQ